MRTRKKKKLIVLHCAGYTDTINREVFKELIAANKRYRKRNRVRVHRAPRLRLVANNSVCRKMSDDYADLRASLEWGANYAAAAVVPTERAANCLAGDGKSASVKD